MNGSVKNFRLRLGRHSGKTLAAVAKRNIGWIVWASETLDEGPTRAALEEFVNLPDIAEQIERWRRRREEKEGKA